MFTKVRENGEFGVDNYPESVHNTRFLWITTWFVDFSSLHNDHSPVDEVCITRESVDRTDR